MRRSAWRLFEADTSAAAMAVVYGCIRRPSTMALTWHFAVSLSTARTAVQLTESTPTSVVRKTAVVVPITQAQDLRIADATGVVVANVDRIEARAVRVIHDQYCAPSARTIACGQTVTQPTLMAIQ